MSSAHAQADCELCGTWVRCEGVLCEDVEDDGVVFEDGSRLTWVRFSAGGSCELIGAYDRWEASDGQLTLSGMEGSETHEYTFHGDLLAFNGELWRQDAERQLHGTCQAAGSDCSDDAECLSGSCEDDRCRHGPGEEDEPDLPGFDELPGASDDEPGEDEPSDPDSDQDPPEGDGDPEAPEADDPALPPEFGDEPQEDDDFDVVGGPGVEGGSPRVNGEQGAADGGARDDNEESGHSGLEANAVEPGSEGCACSVVGRSSSPPFFYSGALAFLGLAWIGRRFRRHQLGVLSGSSRHQDHQGHEGKGNWEKG